MQWQRQCDTFDRSPNCDATRKFNVNWTRRVKLEIHLVQKNTWAEIRKLEISVAPRCQRTHGNIPMRSTWRTGTKDHCIQNVEFDIKKSTKLSFYCTRTIMKSLLARTKLSTGLYEACVLRFGKSCLKRFALLA